MERNPQRHSIPNAWLSGCKAAHARLEVIAERLTNDIARRATLLPGWTVGHLITHLARNADSHRGMVEAAQRGEVIPQYPGGLAQRNRDIEAGSSRSAAELGPDLKAADGQLEAAWSSIDERVWTTGLGLRRYGPATIAEFVLLRWREVEIHLVDLDLPELGSPRWDGLSPEYVEVELSEVMRNLPARVPASTTVVLAPGDRPSRAFGTGDEHVIVEAPAATILAWLMGRGGDSSWPDLRPWE